MWWRTHSFLIFSVALASLRLCCWVALSCLPERVPRTVPVLYHCHPKLRNWLTRWVRRCDKIIANYYHHHGILSASTLAHWYIHIHIHIYIHIYTVRNLHGREYTVRKWKHEVAQSLEIEIHCAAKICQCLKIFEDLKGGLRACSLVSLSSKRMRKVVEVPDLKRLMKSVKGSCLVLLSLASLQCAT